MHQNLEKIGYSSCYNVIVIDIARDLVWLVGDDSGYDEYWYPLSTTKDSKISASEKIVRELATNDFAVDRIIRVGDIITTVSHSGDQPNKHVDIVDSQDFLAVANISHGEEFTSIEGIRWAPFTLSEIENSTPSEICLGGDNMAEIKKVIHKNG